MTPTILLLSALTILISCNNYNQPDNSFITTDNSNPDTVKPIIVTSIESSAYPDIFEAAFGIDTKVTEVDINYNFYRLDIGKLKSESGKLIACDPIVMQGASPFTQTFPIGVFPVQLAMAKNRNNERVAFSRIFFSDKTIAKWELALQQGQKPIPLKDKSFYCYGVDAGTGVFID